tara:strand:- start:587 stop:739 length:153 start_codon:yes stop_codon:yes gene_type:complete
LVGFRLTPILIFGDEVEKENGEIKTLLRDIPDDPNPLNHYQRVHVPQMFH